MELHLVVGYGYLGDGHEVLEGWDTKEKAELRAILLTDDKSCDSWDSYSVVAIRVNKNAKVRS